MSDKPEPESNFSKFYKGIIKSYVLIFSIFAIIYIKKKYLTANPTLLHFALFTTFFTVILTILNMIDDYFFNNLLIGLGITIGMNLFNLQ